MPYGEDWNAHRKLFQQEFHPVHSESMNRLHGRRALGIFLNNLLEAPHDWKAQIRHLVGSIILGVAYGIRIESKDDPYMTAIEKMNMVINEAVLPTNFLVNVIPILKYIPSWFPGASFKRKARAWHGIFSSTIIPPFLKAKEAMLEGTAEDCFSLRCLTNVAHSNANLDHFSKEEEIIMETAGTMYEGGAESGTIALETFMLCVLCFPNIQHTAQAELDHVVGRERLPTYDDKESLPYVTAVIWQPIGPLGAPNLVVKKIPPTNSYFTE
ncbi:hypothetical protein D9757_008997 [Collybiopsis confluens]|uniref:Cytochrome P450 n=1 Tax=Collybiopsis confluens TaxID=2823264 RepID=A0A8H5H3I4_9AGAR|nr:hypothetical protein D9757_008997 [Collybiopsis confluens]